MNHPQEDVTKRVEDLLLDRAMWGLDPAECAELDLLFAEQGEQARAAHDPVDTVAALQVAMGLSSEAIQESIPDDLTERLLADGLAAVESRTSSTVTSSTVTPSMVVESAPAPRVLPTTVEPPSASTPPTSRTATSPAWWLAAAAVLLAFGFWNGLLPTRSVPKSGTDGSLDTLVASLDQDPGSLTLPWSVTEDPIAQGAEGRVVWNTERQEGYMSFRGATPNDPSERQFQLWIFDEARPAETPVDGGVFDIGRAESSGDEWIVPIRSALRVDKPTLFAVTAEQPGGVVVSEREHIVLVASP